MLMCGGTAWAAEKLQKATLSPSLSQAIRCFYVENQPDSVEHYLSVARLDKQSEEDGVLIDLIHIGNLCESGNGDEALIGFNGVADQSQSESPLLRGWYNTVGGLVYFRNEQYQNAYRMLSGAQRINELGSNNKGLVMRMLARTCLNMGDYPGFLDWIDQSTANYQVENQMKSVFINEKLIGRYFMLIDNKESALSYFQKALTGLKTFNDQLEKFYVYVNLTDFNLKSHQIDKAQCYVDSCLMIAMQYDLANLKASSFINLGEIEMAKQQNEKAIGHFQTALSNFIASNDTRGTIATRLLLSGCLLKTTKIREAAHQAQQALALAQQTERRELVRQAHLAMAKVFKIGGQADSALCHTELAMTLKDSLFNVKTAQSKAFYEVKNGLEEKEHELELAYLKHKKQRMGIWALGILLCVISVFALIIYRLLLIRSKNLKALVLKNLELANEKKPTKTADAPNYSMDAVKSLLLYQQVQTFLQTERHYAQKDLTIETTAKELKTNRDYLSKSINEHFGRFNDLVNFYRIQEAEIIISTPAHPFFHHKFEYIADHVGFASYSSFIEAFKKVTKLSPSQFRKNLPKLENTI